jgi:dTDP-4-amino-4,6-dideoxygalactose transaminase
MSSSIPLVDLAAQHRQVADAVASGFARVLEKTAFILGDDVARFEEEFASFAGVAHCAGVANGTDALEIALRALNVGRGDEVILPANTFIATALAVARAGATPVLVDCDPSYGLVDVEQVARKVTKKTKAVVPVHLFGQVAPMEQLLPVCADAGLLVVEDAAQAHGAKRHGKGAGTFGSAAGWSFYPGKNLGAYGDAGAVTTSSADVHKRVKALRNYGSEVKYHHPETGFNSRLDTLQAVVLRCKLQHLARWNASRREAARVYDELLSGAGGVQRPTIAPGNEHVWHLYVVRVKNRDDVLKKLNAAGIGAGVHYPVPIHLQGAFRHLGHKRGDFPVAEKAADEMISLPMFAEITREQHVRVVDELKKALG